MTVELASGAVAGIDFGGQGETVILLHGAGHNAAAWADVASELVDHYRVIAVDLPGHGRSASREDLSYDGLVDVVLSFLDAVGSDCFSVVGHSWGARVALLLGCQARCSAVVLVDGAPAPWWPRVSDADWDLELQQLAQDPWFSQPVTADGLEALRSRSSAGLVERALVDGRLRPSLSDYVAVARAVDQQDHVVFPDRYAEVIARLLVVQAYSADAELAEVNALKERAATALCAEVFDGRWTSIASGHNVPFEKPRELAGVIASFFRGRAA